MFGKRNKVPQRKQFSFTPEQIMEDINNIAYDENEREKLYLCIDEKLPVQDGKFSQLNEFLEGNNNLEQVSVSLKDLCDNLRELSAQFLKDGRKITKVAKEALESANLR